MTTFAMAAGAISGAHADLNVGVRRAFGTADPWWEKTVRG